MSLVVAGETAPEPWRKAAAREEIDRVKEWLLDYPENPFGYRKDIQAFVLRRLQGMTWREVAANCGGSEGWAAIADKRVAAYIARQALWADDVRHRRDAKAIDRAHCTRRFGHRVVSAITRYLNGYGAIYWKNRRR